MRSLDTARDRWKGDIEALLDHHSEPVFEFALAYHRGNNDEAGDLFAKAMHEYIQNKPEYDVVLGDLIPEELRNWADSEISSALMPKELIRPPVTICRFTWPR